MLHRTRGPVLAMAAMVLSLGACKPQSTLRDEAAPSARASIAPPVASAASPAAPSASSPPAPRAAGSGPAGDAPKLRIDIGRAELESTGFVHVLGEVHNETGQPVQRIQVYIDLLDAQGNVLAVDGVTRKPPADLGLVSGERAIGEVVYVPAGGTTPFHYIRDAKKIRGTYAGQRARAVAGAAPATFPIATIDSPRAAHLERDQMMLEGSFKVEGAPCRSPRALFGFYDASGKLVDVAEPRKNALAEWFQKDVSPAQTIAFKGQATVTGAPGAKTKTWGACALR